MGTRTGESRITNILSDERTNSLIILATERAYLRILEMIRRLDVPLEGEGRIHVHYVQNGDAEEIASTLQSLIGGGGSSSRTPSKAGTTKRASATSAGGGGLPDLFEGRPIYTADAAADPTRVHWAGRSSVTKQKLTHIY